MRSALSPLLCRGLPRLRPRLSHPPSTTTQITLNHAAYYSAESPLFDPNTYLINAEKKLASQKSTHIHDALSATPSRLLTISLADHIPSLFPSNHTLPSIENCIDMPQGHHIVYFPPQLPPSQLMSDGTDPAHWPGAPFVRRMWAGGSVVFDRRLGDGLRLDGKPALCVESVGKPLLHANKGYGNEKVFVDVTRRYGAGTNWITGFPAITEVRKLVFMREREGGGESGGKSGEPRIVKMSHTPDFTFSLKPDATLLFHFSALTYNAHAIHLDPDYARNREGYKGLLVHGPLTLVLMLSALRAALEQVKTTEAQALNSLARPRSYIRSIDYRNLAPLYVDEEMRVCLRRTKQEGGELKWDVWVEGPDGGLAVKASALTTDWDPSVETSLEARDEGTEGPKET